MKIGIGLMLGVARMRLTSDVTAPVRSSIATNTGGSKIIVTYNESLGTPAPAAGDFALAGAALATIASAAVVGSTIELTLSNFINQGESGITLSYTPGANPIKDVAGNAAASFATQAVTNSSTRLYTPADEGGLISWVDMQDAATYTVTGGSAVSAIQNKVTSVALTLSTNPPYEAAGLNGKPCLHPTNASGLHRMGGSEAAVLAALAGAHTLIDVFARDVADPAANETLFSCGAASSTATRRTWGHGTTGGGRQRQQCINDSTTSITTESAADNTSTSIQRVAWDASATQISCRVNNGSADPNDAACDPTAGSTQTFTPTKYTYFARNEASPSSPYVGRWGEKLIFNKRLSAAALARVDAYLSAKWS